MLFSILLQLFIFSINIYGTTIIRLSTVLSYSRFIQLKFSDEHISRFKKTYIYNFGFIIILLKLQNFRMYLKPFCFEIIATQNLY